MRKLLIVAGQTYKKNVRSGSFIVMLLSPLLLVGISAFIGLLSGKQAVNTVAIIAPNQTLQQDFVKNQHSNSIKVNEEIKDKKSAEKALKADKIDGYLVFEITDQGVSGTFYDGTKNGTVDTTEIQAYLNQLNTSAVIQANGFTSEQINQLLSPAKFTDKKLNANENKENVFISLMGAMFVSLIIYMVLLLYGNLVTTEVASEKGTRIMEVLLSSSKPSAQFYGKILGILSLCLTQIAVYAAVFVGVYYAFKDTSGMKELLEKIDIVKILQSLLGYNALYLFIGVMGYCSLAAMCGSLVSKAEDAGKAVQPLTFLVMIGFFVGITGMTNADTLVIKIGSFIPFLSPMIMPYRIAQNLVSTSEIWISLGLSLIVNIGVLYFGEKLYRSNVLVYNDKGILNAMKESLSILKNEKKKTI